MSSAVTSAVTLALLYTLDYALPDSVLDIMGEYLDGPSYQLLVDHLGPPFTSEKRVRQQLRRMQADHPKDLELFLQAHEYARLYLHRSLVGGFAQVRHTLAFMTLMMVYGHDLEIQDSERDPSMSDSNAHVYSLARRKWTEMRSAKGIGRPTDRPIHKESSSIEYDLERLIGRIDFFFNNYWDQLTVEMQTIGVTAFQNFVYTEFNTETPPREGLIFDPSVHAHCIGLTQAYESAFKTQNKPTLEHFKELKLDKIFFRYRQ